MAVETTIDSYRLRVEQHVAELKTLLKENPNEDQVEELTQSIASELAVLYALHIEELGEDEDNQRALLEQHYAEDVGMIAAIVDEVMSK